jgi:hypothetical protein
LTRKGENIIHLESDFFGKPMLYTMGVELAIILLLIDEKLETIRTESLVWKGCQVQKKFKSQIGNKQLQKGQIFKNEKRPNFLQKLFK